MKKIIRTLLILILLFILSLIVVFVFNPFETRTKLIGSIINSYLSASIEGYTPLEIVPVEEQTPAISNQVVEDKHPFLNEEQEKRIESYGVDVSQLPTSVTPGMQECFLEKMGEERGMEIVGGATPSAFEIIKARECIGK